MYIYFRKGESYKVPKVVYGDDGNLRAKPPSWSRGRAHRGSAREWEFGDFAHETKHVHTCQSVLLAILFKSALKVLKISQPVTFSHISPAPPPIVTPVSATDSLYSSVYLKHFFQR